MSNDGATVWYTTMNKWPMLLWIGSLRKHIASYHSRPVISQRKINPIHCHCFIPYTGVPLCQSVLRVTLDDEGWCFGRLVSMRRIWVLCISNFQSRKPNNCWLWKYKFGEYLLQTFSGRSEHKSLMKVLKNRMATDQHRMVLNKTNTVSKFEENWAKPEI